MYTDTSEWRRLVHLVYSRLSVDTKVRLYQTCILLILLYGSEKWMLLADDRCRLQSFHMNCRRQLLSIKCHFRIWNAGDTDNWQSRWSRNADIADMTGLAGIQEIIDNRRLGLFGHVIQLDARILAHEALKLSTH